MPNNYVVLKEAMFQHFDQMNSDFLAYLDFVLQGCGWFTKITSDYRTPADQSVQQQAGHGAAIKSLHELGRAVDLRVPRNLAGEIDVWKMGLFIDAVSFYRKGRTVELELDITPNDAHIHIALYPDDDKRGMKLLLTCRHTT